MELSETAGQCERRLGVQIVPRPAPRAARTKGVDRALVDAVRNVAASNGGKVHMGTDGGAKGKRQLAAATWGVVVAEPIPEMLPEIPSGSEDEGEIRMGRSDIYGVRRPVGLQTSSKSRARQKIRERREENARRKRKKGRTEPRPNGNEGGSRLGARRRPNGLGR